jgi:cysteine sulfinate desulfinase/cysteine desulfurase-like protein
LKADSSKPPAVVKATKPDSSISRHMIRFSLGWKNTELEVEATLSAIARAVRALRG